MTKAKTKSRIESRKLRAWMIIALFIPSFAIHAQYDEARLIVDHNPKSVTVSPDFDRPILHEDLGGQAVDLRAVGVAGNNVARIHSTEMRGDPNGLLDNFANGTTEVNMTTDPTNADVGVYPLTIGGNYVPLGGGSTGGGGGGGGSATLEDWEGLTEAEVKNGVLSKIEYFEPGDSGNEGTWKDVGDTLYVTKGTTVTFRADKDSGTEWPEGKPEWSGTSGVSGEGIQKQVEFSEVGDKTVTVEAGNAITTTVKVVQVNPVMESLADFEGHALDRLGVAESAFLKFDTEPANVSANDLGGLKWTLDDGNGILTDPNPNDGKAVYKAPGTANDPEGEDATINTVALTVKNGPSKGQSFALPLTIVPPTGLRLVHDAEKGVVHTQNKASITIIVRKFVLPDDVSFDGIKVKELPTNPQMEGWFLAHGNELIPDPDDSDQNIERWKVTLKHEPGPPALVAPPNNANEGSSVGASDYAGGIFNATPGPYDQGILTWEIPVAYSADEGQTWTQFTTATQIFTITDESLSIEKKDGDSTTGKISKQHSDPDSYFQ